MSVMSLDSKSLLFLSPLHPPVIFIACSPARPRPLPFSLPPFLPSLPLPPSLLLPPLNNTPDKHCRRTKHSTSQVFIPHRGHWRKGKKRRKIRNEQVLQTLLFLTVSPAACSSTGALASSRRWEEFPDLPFLTYNIG